jgi:hypothetical protein
MNDILKRSDTKICDMEYQLAMGFKYYTIIYLPPEFITMNQYRKGDENAQ